MVNDKIIQSSTLMVNITASPSSTTVNTERTQTYVSTTIIQSSNSMVSTKVSPFSSLANTGTIQYYTSTPMANIVINSSSNPVGNNQTPTPSELGQNISRDTEKFQRLGWKAFMEQRHVNCNFSLLDNVHHPA